MKIKKHGKLFKGSTEKDKYEQFKCDNCGCEFSVKEDEYYRDYGGTDLSTNSSITVKSNYTWLSVDTLVCSCPECYKICKKSVYAEYGLNYSNYVVTSGVSSGSATAFNLSNRINNEVK